MKISKILINENEYDIDAKMLSQQSNFFARSLVGLADLKNMRKSTKISEFLALCHGKIVPLSISDMYEILLLADEWEAPKIIQMATKFLDKSQTPNDLLTAFYEQTRKVYSISLLGLVSSHFVDLLETELIYSLPADIILQVISNPHCSLPAQSNLAKFIQRCLNNGPSYTCLLKFLDLSNVDEQILQFIFDFLSNNNQIDRYPQIRDAHSRKRLRNRVQTTNNILIDQQCFSSSLKIKNTFLNNKIDSMRKEGTSPKKAKEDQERLIQRKNKLTDDINIRTIEIAKNSVETERLFGEINEKEARNMRINEELKIGIQSKEQEYEQLSIKLETMNKEKVTEIDVEEKENQINQFKEELAQLQAEHERIQQIFDDADKKIQQIEQETSDFRKMEDEIKAQIEQYNQQKEHERQQQLIQEAINQDRAEFDELIQQIQNIKSQLAGLVQFK